MTKKEKEEVLNKLKEIKPGKNYPAMVKIVEEVNGKEHEIKFLLESYAVGMYSAMYVDDALEGQSGDHNNSTFVRNLKRDVKNALDRKTKSVEIGIIRPVKTLEEATP